jgi:2-oxoglutarate decarboxylase
LVYPPFAWGGFRPPAAGVDDFTSGTFQPVIPDDELDPSGVDRVLLCSGKVYHDLIAGRAKRQDTATAIVRLEQLYPLDVAGIAAAVDRYRGAQLVWVQDEPANQGPWPFIALTLPQELNGRPLLRISRPASASPATGSSKKHQSEQAAIIAQAFNR